MKIVDLKVELNLDEEEYQVLAVYDNGEIEVVDADESEKEAQYLLGEYRIAFGV